MLIFEIAGGIVLAFVIITYWHQILKGVVWLGAIISLFAIGTVIQADPHAAEVARTLIGGTIGIIALAAAWVLLEMIEIHQDGWKIRVVWK